MKRVQLASENQHAATVASNAQLLHRVGRHSAGRHRYSQLAAHSSVDLPPALSGIIEHGDQAPLYKRRKMSGPATLRVSFRSNGEPSQVRAHCVCVVTTQTTQLMMHPYLWASTNPGMCSSSTQNFLVH